MKQTIAILGMLGLAACGGGGGGGGTVSNVSNPINTTPISNPVVETPAPQPIVGEYRLSMHGGADGSAQSPLVRDNPNTPGLEVVEYRTIRNVDGTVTREERVVDFATAHPVLATAYPTLIDNARNRYQATQTPVVETPAPIAVDPADVASFGPWRQGTVHGGTVSRNITYSDWTVGSHPSTQSRTRTETTTTSAQVRVDSRTCNITVNGLRDTPTPRCTGIHNNIVRVSAPSTSVATFTETRPTPGYVAPGSSAGDTLGDGDAIDLDRPNHFVPYNRTAWKNEVRRLGILNELTGIDVTVKSGTVSSTLFGAQVDAIRNMAPDTTVTNDTSITGIEVSHINDSEDILKIKKLPTDGTRFSEIDDNTTIVAGIEVNNNETELAGAASLVFQMFGEAGDAEIARTVHDDFTNADNQNADGTLNLGSVLSAHGALR